MFYTFSMSSVLSQKRETWNRSVGWYAFTPENVSFRKMTMNGATKPVTVKLEEAVETELPAEGQERDSEFGKFVQKTLGRDLFSSIQITGDGFSQDWAEPDHPLYSVLETGAERLLRRTGSRLLCPGKGRSHDR